MMRYSLLGQKEQPDSLTAYWSLGAKAQTAETQNQSLFIGHLPAPRRAGVDMTY